MTTIATVRDTDVDVGDGAADSAEEVDGDGVPGGDGVPDGDEEL